MREEVLVKAGVISLLIAILAGGISIPTNSTFLIGYSCGLAVIGVMELAIALVVNVRSNRRTHE